MSAYLKSRGILVQGDKLAVLSDFSSSGLILDGYEVSSLSVESRAQDLFTYGYGVEVASVSLGLSARVEIRSLGSVTMVDKDIIEKAFRSPEEMSIEDLLRIVYRKMDQRSEDDD